MAGSLRSGEFGANGTTLSYVLEGEGAEVVFIHGVGANKESWDECVAALGPGFRSLRFDLRGHGQSAKSKGPYSLEMFVEDIAGLLDHVGFKRPHMVGFSLGGLIAQAFGVLRGDRVDRLVILSAIAGRTEAEWANVHKRLATLETDGAGAHYEAALERWFTPEFRAAHPDIIEKRRIELEGNHRPSYAAAYRVFALSDMADRLHVIKNRTLVITGEGDPGSNPRMSRLMHERIANSELVIMPRLCHSVLVEGPEVVAGHLHRFLTAP
ncbi:MAG: alpha/beta fold hydrolase [Alphaproteobacteria bacterium]